MALSSNKVQPRDPILFHTQPGDQSLQRGLHVGSFLQESCRLLTIILPITLPISFKELAPSSEQVVSTSALTSGSGIIAGRYFSMIDSCKQRSVVMLHGSRPFFSAFAAAQKENKAKKRQTRQQGPGSPDHMKKRAWENFLLVVNQLINGNPPPWSPCPQGPACRLPCRSRCCPSSALQTS